MGCDMMTPGAILMLWAKLWLEAISGSLALLQSESMLRSVAPVVIMDHAAAGHIWI